MQNLWQKKWAHEDQNIKCFFWQNDSNPDAITKSNIFKLKYDHIQTQDLIFQPKSTDFEWKGPFHNYSHFLLAIMGWETLAVCWGWWIAKKWPKLYKISQNVELILFHFGVMLPETESLLQIFTKIYLPIGNVFTKLFQKK